MLSSGSSRWQPASIRPALINKIIQSFLFVEEWAVLFQLKRKGRQAFGLKEPVNRAIIRSLFSARGVPMTHQILTELAASISELKANPMKVVASGEGMPIAVLNRNEPAFYCVPAKAYEAMMDLIEDKELLEIARSRMNEESIKVNLDDL